MIAAATKPPTVFRVFTDEMGYLADSVASFRNILDDKRFPRSAKVIAKRHLNDLWGYVADLQRVTDALMEVTP